LSPSPRGGGESRAREYSRHPRHGARGNGAPRRFRGFRGEAMLHCNSTPGADLHDAVHGRGDMRTAMQHAESL